MVGLTLDETAALSGVIDDHDVVYVVEAFALLVRFYF